MFKDNVGATGLCGVSLQGLLFPPVETMGFQPRSGMIQVKHTMLLSQSKFAIGAAAIKTLWSQRKLEKGRSFQGEKLIINS